MSTAWIWTQLQGHERKGAKALKRLFHVQTDSGASEEYFSKGAKLFFRFFSRRQILVPSRNSHFGRPKTNFSGFQKFRFAFFSSTFSFFPPLGQQKLPVRGRGGTLPPTPPPPACYATEQTWNCLLYMKTLVRYIWMSHPPVDHKWGQND